MVAMQRGSPRREQHAHCAGVLRQHGGASGPCDPARLQPRCTCRRRRRRVSVGTSPADAAVSSVGAGWARGATGAVAAGGVAAGGAVAVTPAVGRAAAAVGRGRGLIRAAAWRRPRPAATPGAGPAAMSARERARRSARRRSSRSSGRGTDVPSGLARARRRPWSPSARARTFLVDCARVAWRARRCPSRGRTYPGDWARPAPWWPVPRERASDPSRRRRGRRGRAREDDGRRLALLRQRPPRGARRAAARATSSGLHSEPAVMRLADCLAAASGSDCDGGAALESAMRSAGAASAGGIEVGFGPAVAGAAAMVRRLRGHLPGSGRRRGGRCRGQRRLGLRDAIGAGCRARAASSGAMATTTGGAAAGRRVSRRPAAWCRDRRRRDDGGPARPPMQSRPRRALPGRFRGRRGLGRSRRSREFRRGGRATAGGAGRRCLLPLREE
jgi:hypothetical protein